MEHRRGERGIWRRRLRALPLLLALVLGTWVGQAQAAPPAQSPDEGERLFQALCSACHTVGQGDLLGPDLKGVSANRDHDWLTRWLLAPDQLLAEQDPIAVGLLKEYNNVPMPNQGLTEADVASIIAFLVDQDGGTPAPEPTATAEPAAATPTPARATQVPSQEATPAAEPTSTPAPAIANTPQPGAMAARAGDPNRGRDLFTGAARFQAGGPACAACHTVAGMGAMGGGAMGPDLTGSHAKLGDTLIVWTESVPPMSVIYTEKPLAQDEKADLLAFLSSATGSGGLSGAGPLAGLAAGGAALLLGTAGIVWLRRIGGVRRSLLARRSSPSRGNRGG